MPPRGARLGILGEPPHDRRHFLFETAGNEDVEQADRPVRTILEIVRDACAILGSSPRGLDPGLAGKDRRSAFHDEENLVVLRVRMRARTRRMRLQPPFRDAVAASRFPPSALKTARMDPHWYPRPSPALEDHALGQAAGPAPPSRSRRRSGRGPSPRRSSPPLPLCRRSRSSSSSPSACRGPGRAQAAPMPPRGGTAAASPS